MTELEEQYAAEANLTNGKPLVYIASAKSMLRTEGWIVRFGDDGQPEVSKSAQIALDIKMVKNDLK